MIRAIIVDDEPAVANIITHFIEKEHLPVEIVGKACNGQEALTLIGQKKPQLAFLDIQMPMMNGLEATRAIRSLSSPDAQLIPIIAMTANAFPEDIAATRQAGMNEHLSKPVNMKHFQTVLKKWCHK